MKVQRKSFLALALTASFVLVGESQLQAEHPFHVSLAEIEFNEKTQAFEVSLCVWAEDVESVLSLDSDQPFDLDRIGTRQADAVLQKYLKKHFVVEISGKPLPMVWHGHELEKRKLWVYFEMKCDQPPKMIQFRNQLLLDLHEQQANLMQIKIGKQQKSLTSTIANSEFVIRN